MTKEQAASIGLHPGQLFMWITHIGKHEYTTFCLLVSVTGPIGDETIAALLFDADGDRAPWCFTYHDGEFRYDCLEFCMTKLVCNA